MVSEELLAKLRRRFMEKGTGRIYKNIFRVCRDARRKVKVHLEINLAKDAKNNKGFFKYTIIKKGLGRIWIHR